MWKEMTPHIFYLDSVNDNSLQKEVTTGVSKGPQTELWLCILAQEEISFHVKKIHVDCVIQENAKCTICT